MNINEIKGNLCYYDERNPDFLEGIERDNSKSCYCDNCFRGKTKLAICMLNIIETNSELLELLQHAVYKFEEMGMGENNDTIIYKQAIKKATD